MRSSKLVGLGVFLALVIFIMASSLFIIDETEQAIIVQFGEYMRTVDEPGMHFKYPFIQNAYFLERRVLVSDARPTEYLSLDKKRVVVDHLTRWKIVDPHQFYRSVRTEAGALARLDDLITGRLREEIARHDFEDIIREDREAIMTTVTTASNLRAADFGIEVLDTRIKRIDLPREVEMSVFSRMEAERERMASRYRAEGEERAREIRAQANMEKEIILAGAFEQSEILRGEGDALAATIYANAFQQDEEFYSFVKRLEIYETLITKDSTLVLGTDSELFEYFRSPRKVE